MANGTRIGIRKASIGRAGSTAKTAVAFPLTLPLTLFTLQVPCLSAFLLASSLTRTPRTSFFRHSWHVHAFTGSARACGTVLLAMQCLSQPVVPAGPSLQSCPRNILLFCLLACDLKQPWPSHISFALPPFSIADPPSIVSVLPRCTN